MYAKKNHLLHMSHNFYKGKKKKPITAHDTCHISSIEALVLHIYKRKENHLQHMSHCLSTGIDSIVTGVSWPYTRDILGGQ